MSLRARVAFGVALLTLVAVSAFGALAYAWFVRAQESELRRVLEQDLARVVALLEAPVLGASIVDPGVPGFVVQVIAADGRLVLAWGGDEPLPASAAPTAVTLDGRRHVVAQAPWPGAAGTVRVAHDVEGAWRTRTDLARILWAGGALTFALASLVAIGTARRALRPLTQVALAARRVDPAAPAPIAYAGGRDEIGALTDALNATLAAIAARSRAERTFLLEVAHELAAPLTLVDYHLAALRRERPDDGGVRAASQAARELLHTSQDLLVLARGELERPLDASVFDLRDVVERVAAEYPGVHVDAADAAEAVGDADRLVQVVRNLVRNGVQAAGRAEGVRLALHAGPDEHRIEVVDDGPGLDEQELANLFERGRRRAGGTGVGLAIAKSLVERHGGSIAVVSALGAGARFSVTLPSLEARLEDGDDGAGVSDS